MSTTLCWCDGDAMMFRVPFYLKPLATALWSTVAWWPLSWWDAVTLVGFVTPELRSVVTSMPLWWYDEIMIVAYGHSNTFLSSFYLPFYLLLVHLPTFMFSSFFSSMTVFNIFMDLARFLKQCLLRSLHFVCQKYDMIHDNQKGITLTVPISCGAFVYCSSGILLCLS